MSENSMINQEDMSQFINNFNKKRDEFRKNMMAEFSELLQSYAKLYFERHPVAQSFGWVQYTPSFNDGDPCEFGIYEACLNGVGGYTSKYDGKRYLEMYGDMSIELDGKTYHLDEGDLDRFKTSNNPEEVRIFDLVFNAFYEAEDFKSNVVENSLDIVQAIFEQPAKIFVNRDGTVQKEYTEVPY